MGTTQLNKEAYSVAADNLILAAEFPIVTRKLTVNNPQVALSRGMAIIQAYDVTEAKDSAGTGTVDVFAYSDDLYIAGDDNSGTAYVGEIIGILKDDAAADTTNATIDVYAYVSGAFNIASVSSLEDDNFDVTDVESVIAAQRNGIYLL